MSLSTGILGVEEAARACGVSDETIRRRLRAGRFAGAHRVSGSASAWRIPIVDLLSNGFTPQLRPSDYESTPPSDVVRLRADLAAAIATANERHERIAQLERHVADLRAVLRVLEGTR